MTDYSKFRKSPDMTDWMRTAQARVFTRELAEQRDIAFKNLVATCEKSTDPKVTSAVTRWAELNKLTNYLENSRREGVSEDA